MGEIKSLMENAAIEKIKELANDKICLLCTYENGSIVSRPMGTQGIDDDGSIWFFSKKDSAKNQQIDQNDTVYLMYMDTSNHAYLSLTGTADIVDDREKIHALWNPLAKAWFEEGKDDPSISLLKITPSDGHYWDTKNGKLISMIKIAIAAVTGKPMDGGIEGDIRIS